jgi:hypothetical protein
VTGTRAAGRTVKAMAWGPLGAAAGVLAGIVVATRPWDGGGLSLLFVRIAVFLAAIGAAFAVDDAASVTLAASPTTLWRRRLVRLVLAAGAAVATAVTATVAVAAAGGVGSLPAARVAVEASAVLLLALMSATALGGDRGAITFATIVMAAILLQQRRPDLALFPMAPSQPGWTGSGVAWVVIAVAAAAALAAMSVDPAARARATCASRRSSVATWLTRSRRRCSTASNGAPRAGSFSRSR